MAWEQWLGWLKNILPRAPQSPTPGGVQYTLYTRERGPICYEFKLFPWCRLRERFFRQLFGSSLRWYWESARGCDPEPASVELGLPEKRPLTLLTEATTQEFVKDLEERDLDDDMRCIVLYGVDPQASPGASLASWMRAALQEFLQQESGPLWLVAVQIGDLNYELVFVPHEPAPPVRELLRVWGVWDTPPYRVRRYRSLGVAQLEYMRPPDEDP
ncbi:MAG: hypothetical protein NZ914_15045 [Gemmatales bacterium]|nr:hypothetical protein [Gemmatales bacterium]MDW8224160.1 hypothetical protein [Gemmatales bacterium]